MNQLVQHGIKPNNWANNENLRVTHGGHTSVRYLSDCVESQSFTSIYQQTRSYQNFVVINVGSKWNFSKRQIANWIGGLWINIRPNDTEYDKTWWRKFSA